MHPRLKFALVSALLLLPVLAWAGFVRQGPAHAQFHATGPAGFKLEGESETVLLQDDGTTFRVIVPLAELKTGIALRDHHMHDKYLQVSQFPNAVLEVPWSAVTLPADGATSRGTGTGKMTLHGQTREVPFTYSIARSGNSFQVSGAVPLDLTTFGINIPSYLGVTVKKDITTEVTFQAAHS